jgi:ABC-type methionine transport system ATPase subunit
MELAIGLSFPGHLQDESVICALCKKFDITLNIIEASFSVSAGWAILKIQGDDAEIKKAFAYLASKDVKIQQIETRR